MATKKLSSNSATFSGTIASSSPTTTKTTPRSGPNKRSTDSTARISPNSKLMSGYTAFKAKKGDHDLSEQ